MLISMAGLPGSGKSTLAVAIGRAVGAPVISVDPIEAAMWRAGVARDQPTGLAAYVVAEAVAAEVLTLGQTVIVDAVNDVEPARAQWRTLAERLGIELRFVEVCCSDVTLHRQRLAQRRRDLVGFVEPSWDAVVRRRERFAPWIDDRLVLDSVHAVDSNIDVALDYLRLPARKVPGR